MRRYSEGLEHQINELRERILADPLGVMDAEGVHHEFVSGNHGRKLDIDKIETGSDFYAQLVAAYAHTISATYADGLPEAVVGIANGANRLSRSVAALLGKRVLGLCTVKVDERSARLDDEALEAINHNQVAFALTVDDVGTTGSTVATAVDHLRAVGVQRVEAFSVWQRNLSLPYLDTRGVSYSSMIHEPLPMFTPEECLSNPDGYCARGIALEVHE